MDKATLSGIIKHQNGYGFKITFNSIELARRCKKMMYFILKAEKNLEVDNLNAYHDKKEE